MAKIKCAKCGAELPEDAKFCIKCGQPFNKDAVSLHKNGHNENKKTVYALLGILGFLILIVLGAMLYSEYSEAREARLAREKYIADSLEQARRDSIQLAKQKEKERIEAEKLAKFQERMSFENFIGMLKHYNKQSYATKCGLTLLYRQDTKEEYGTCTEIVYGYDVEKGSKNDYGYDIIAKSNHACYFKYMLDTSTGARMSFKDSNEAESFFKKAEDYGLIFYGDMPFIPNKRLPNGKSINLDIDDESVSIYDMAYGSIDSPSYQDGWYSIYIGLDF